MNSLKKFSKIKIFSLALCCMALLSLSSCLDTDAPPDSPVAYISFYHGSPDGPDLTIRADNNPINIEAFEYSQFRAYQRFFPGTRNFKFGPYNSSTTDIEDDIVLERDKFYSVFIAGEYEDAELVVINDNTTAPATGKAKVRIINLSPDAGSIDFKIPDAETDWVSDLVFKEITEFMEVDAGDYDFQVRATSNDDLLLPLSGVRIKAGSYYTIVIRGYRTPPVGGAVLAGQLVEN